MAFCPSGFNGNACFRCQIIDLINKYIFDNSRCQLCKRYCQMQTNSPVCDYNKSPKNPEFEKEYTDGPKMDQVMLRDIFRPLWIEHNLGHDLPVWFTESEQLSEEINKELQGLFENINNKLFQACLLGSTSNTIMFIGIDPMRIRQRAGVISLSSPWGLHSSTYRSKGTAKLICMFFSHFKPKNIYVTDRNKLYVDMFNNQNNHSNHLFTIDPSYRFEMYDCLVDEINLVHPNIIFFVGGGKAFREGPDFKNVYYKLRSGLKNIIFQIPHPAHNNWTKHSSRAYWYDMSTNTWR